VELLAGKWRGRIAVIGENDRREPQPIAAHPHPPGCRCCQRCWPGRYGAEVIVDELRRAFTWPPVVGRMPPPTMKDLRAWVNEAIKNPEDVEACKRVGKSLMRQLHLR
jgi:hypothetical protein